MTSGAIHQNDLESWPYRLSPENAGVDAEENAKY